MKTFTSNFSRKVFMTLFQNNFTSRIALNKALFLFLIAGFILMANRVTAQYSSLSTLGYVSGVPRYGINGVGGVTFNVKAYGHKVIIKRLWTEFAGGSCVFNIYYKTDSINAAPNTGTQPWILAGTSPAKTSTTPLQASIDTIPLLLNIEIPAGRTYGFWISTVSGGLYYLAPGSSDTSFRTDGNIHINMGNGVGYGGAAPVVVATPRQFVGKVEYTVVPNPANEASLSSITSPVSGYCAGSYPVKAMVTNNGSNRIDSVRVRWTLDGVAQTGVNVTTPIDTPGHPSNPNSLEVILSPSVTFGAGVTRTIKVWTAYPNGVVDTVNTDDTVQVVRHDAMNGTYTIGGTPGPANFATFRSADSALQAYGVCGPVTINVAPGTYNERVELIGPIVGASPINWITFEGTDPATRIITYNSTGDAAKFHTVKLEGVKYVTFRNFTVNALGTDNAFGILMRGGGVSNIYIRKCIVNLVNVPASTYTTSQQFAGIIMTGAENSATTGSGRADSLQIDSNTINYGYYGIIHFGAGGAQDWNCMYRNNTINNIYYYGMHFQYHDGCKILNNRISMRADATAGYSMYLTNLTGTAAAGNTEISGNKMTGLGNYGMYLSTCVNLATAKGIIANNMIGGLTRTSTYGGIYLASGNNYWSIANNSVNFDLAGASASYSPLYIGSATGVSVMNNIFSVKQTGSTALPMYIGATTYVDSVNYNICYRADTSNNQLIYLGATYNTGNFKGGGGFNANSMYSNPGFVNDTNLHLTSACSSGITLATGMALPYVTTDFDGTTRLSTPLIGAHELIPFSNDMTVVSISQPTAPYSSGLQDMTVKVKNIGSNGVSFFTLSYKLNGGTAVSQSYGSSTLNPCDTMSLTFTGTQQINLTTVNNLKVYTSGPNASTDPNRSNDTLNLSLYTPLNGIFTINPSGTGPANFTSFGAAVTALTTSGVAGPVTFNVAAGTYNEAVNINGTINGLTAATPILFDGGAGNAATRIITANVPSNGTVIINQKNYIRFRNLTITNTNGNNPAGAAAQIIGSNVTNSGTGCGFSNCVLNLPNVLNYQSAAINISASTTGYSVSGTIAADSIEIDSNVINGGYYGIGFTGASGASYNRGIKFRRNTINAYTYGMYVSSIYNPLEITNNTVNMYTISGAGANYGMYCPSNTNSSTTVSSLILSNKVTGSSIYGMYFSNPGGTVSAPVKIYNNMVSSASFNAYNCLYLTTGGYTEIYHNTLVYNFITATTNYGALYYTGSVNAWVRNNIFGHEGTGTGSATPAYFAASPAGNQVNFNNYYNKTGTTLLYRLGTYTAANYHTNTAGGDSSYNMIPAYVDAVNNNMHITNSCAQRGADLSAYVPTDIDGETRGIPGQIGCDDYPTTALDLMVDALLQPTSPVAAGSQNVRVRVRNNGANTITSFSIAYKLNSGTAVVLSPAWTGSLASCDTVTVTFSGAQQLTIAPNSVNSLKVYTYNPNSSADGNRTNDTATVTISTPMIGTYTIGTTSSDFTTFSAAVTALQSRGVGGNVTMNVRTGNYTGPVTIPAITGASASSTITFTSLANNADSVVINAASGADPYIIALNGCSYINFKNLTINSTTISSAQNGINISGAASFDSVVNCKISIALYLVNNTSNTGYIIYASALGTTSNGLVIKNNIMSGSYYGVYLYGTSQANPFLNCVFDGNSITDAYVYSVNSNYSNGLIFKNNIITPNPNYTAHGIYLQYTDSVIITNNKINLTNNSTVNLGYYARGGVTTKRCLVANNVITGSVAVAAPTINLGYQSSNIDFYHNSIHVPSTTQAAYIYNSGAIGQNFKNNVFSNRGTGTAAYFSAIPSPANVVMDHNNYYTTGATLINGASTQTTLAGWKAACNCDKNSVSYRAGFMSNTDLTPNPADTAVWSLNGRGTHVGILTDVNGASRPATVSAGVPDIGAYEVLPTVIPPQAIGTPATPAAGITQTYLFASDTVAKITWDVSVTPPSGFTVRQYSGVRPLQISLSNNYMYFYTDMPAPTGYYNTLINLYYKDSWLGTVPSESDSKLAQKGSSTASWNPYTGALSSVDSVRNIISATAFFDFGYFTGTDNNNPLPVILAEGINATQVGKDVMVNWSTVSEINSNNFEIEVSYDGKNFSSIGTVKASGQSNQVIKYAWLHEGAFADYDKALFYRIKMIDRDGSFEYSNTAVVVPKNGLKVVEVTAVPNPFNTITKLNITSQKDVNAVITVTDITGKLIMSDEVQLSKGFNSVELNKLQSHHDGLYFVKVNIDNESVSLKLLKASK